MDDPGWGEYVPVPEDEQKKPGKPASGGGRKGGGFSVGPLSGWTAIGVAVLVVIVIVGVVVKLTGGGSKKATPPTTAATTTTKKPTTTHAVTTTTTTKPKPKVKPKPVSTVPAGELSKTAYIKKADTICKAYKTPMATAESADNLPLLETLFKREIKELSNLPPPDRDAQTMTQALTDAEDALVSLREDDITTANKYIIATDTLVGVFGMHVCNYGH
jgi:hypothetical protein